ncbi:MAG: hypothetical protein ABSE93_18975 [Terriglobia bacterium]|jgi:hypothetical protein
METSNASSLWRAQRSVAKNLLLVAAKGGAVYFPEIFPTRIQATGAGFCFNAGRIFAAAGPFLTGYLVVHLGSFARAASSIALIYVLSLLILPFARETRGEVIQ